MNDAIPAARRLALVGYNDALRASDATRLEMNYLVTTASANTTLEKRITSLFGSFQMATRRSMASENFDSDVLEDFYDSEVDWSIQTNRLRQQYYAANGSAKNAYNVALRSAATTRQTNLLNAAAKYNVDVFNAEEIYAKATAAADSVRTLASYESAKKFYEECIEKGYKPALFALCQNREPVIPTNDELKCWEVNRSTDMKLNDVFNKIDDEIPWEWIVVDFDFDYALLANIDTGNGTVPQWIHAEGAFHDGLDNHVVITPVKSWEDHRSVIWGVIVNVDEVNKKYNLHFDSLPEAPWRKRPREFSAIL